MYCLKRDWTCLGKGKEIKEHLCSGLADYIKAGEASHERRRSCLVLGVGALMCMELGLIVL